MQPRLDEIALASMFGVQAYQARRQKGFIMAAFQTVTSYLNAAFSRDNIGQIASKRELFAPGRSLAQGVVVKEGTRLHALWVEYLGKLPGSFQEVMRSTIYYSLSTEPPTPIVFAWAPGYDYELTIWHSPDTPPTKGGITILMKSRYPSDAHPAEALKAG
jgi:hypothetical protein